MIPYGKQSITDADIKAVVDVLKSDFLTQGPKVPEFEKMIAEFCGVSHVIAVNSATSALHIACLALGVGQGDIVWTSPNSFVASSNCALYCGASVDFVDTDPRTFNMSPALLEEKLKSAKAKGTLPKVVIPVHLTGQSCEMEAIHKLGQEYGFKIIEDASHCIGGKYQDQPIGNCKFSDIVVFSFHPVKIITTAEGGVCTTQSAELSEQLNLLRSHGVTREKHLMTHESHGPWYYQQVALGLNYRMTEMQAALGCSQMDRLVSFTSRRHEVAARYNNALKDLPISLPYQISDSYSGWHLYVIQLDLDSIERSHREVFEALRSRGLGVNVHYIPIHTQPYYKDLGFRPGDFPNAESYYSKSISIPIFHAMTDEQQDSVIDILREELV